jgi:hypothetical protein
MTSLPNGGLSKDYDCAFFKDSFNRLVVKSKNIPLDLPMSESFTKLTARADQYRGLWASIDDWHANLLPPQGVLLL